ncbi:complement inhibitor CirpT1 [Eupeodes corollae]|uniref:complement inhibitor CirpT1 n=1 Tax=Eupeodes corollae TaxID=290404 RepID=UPI00248FE147|nr:complement inhibitor CirpT1 [Eupeodes corollae]
MSSLKISAIISVLIIVCAISYTNAAIFSQPALYHPAHPGKCFDKFTHRSMLPNKEYKPKGICAAMTCDIDTMTINIETCPSMDMPECQELKTDPTWSFPKCCPQYVCKDFKTGKDVIFSA